MSLAPLHWHLFCRVIDNFGDIGVAWRLARQIAASGDVVTLWCDDRSALAWMAADGDPSIDVRDWPTTLSDGDWPHDEGDGVVIELFGCALPDAVQARMAAQAQRWVWLNLEYLSAERQTARNHGLRSPVMTGPARGMDKWFFYPGFTADTGGLLREADLGPRQAAFDRAAWRRQSANLSSPGAAELKQWISLFCYEPGPLGAALAALKPKAQHLLVTPGRTQQAVAAHAHRDNWPNHWQAVNWCSQDEFDAMLWACDLNLVRGEDSLVRALWAGQAFVWQIYPQDDGAHQAKLQAFLDWLDAPADWRQAHLLWNGLSAGRWQWPDATRLEAWRECAQQAGQRLLAQDDLLSALRQFVQTHRPGAPTTGG